jgi:hypothetical protein
MKSCLRAHHNPRLARFAALVLALILVHPLATSAVAPAAHAQPASTSGSCAPGVEFLGFSEALNKTSFGGFDVAELSGLSYDRQRDVYYVIADRAGSVQSHIFTLDLPLARKALGVPSIRAVTVLRDESGVAFTGASFDGEGVALTRQGSLIVASEGGSAAGEQPEIRVFSRAGAQFGELAVPARFLVGTNNLSFESLALSPNGRSLFTATERALPAVGSSPADGQTADGRSRIRILRYEDRGPGGFRAAEQYYYLTDPDRAANDVGVVDLVALSETELLVLERGFVAGQGNTVRLYRVSLAGAQDVSAQPTLAAPGLTPLAKTLVFDLANCPPGGATIPPGATQPNALLDNFEGIALGPALPGGRRALVLISDDNAAANQVTRLVVVAIPTAPPNSLADLVHLLAECAADTHGAKP